MTNVLYISNRAYAVFFSVLLCLASCCAWRLAYRHLPRRYPATTSATHTRIYSFSRTLPCLLRGRRQRRCEQRAHSSSIVGAAGDDANVCLISMTLRARKRSRGYAETAYLFHNARHAMVHSGRCAGKYQAGTYWALYNEHGAPSTSLFVVYLRMFSRTIWRIRRSTM